MSSTFAPRARARWPWILGLVLGVIAIWRLEVHRAAEIARSSDPRVERTEPGNAWRFVDVRRRPPIRFAWPRRWSNVGVSGHVFDADSGAAVAGAEVVFADGASESDAITDARGAYHIELPPGRYRPFVRGDDVLAVGTPQRTRQQGVRPQPDQMAAPTLRVAPELAVFDELAGIDLEVVRSAVVRGRVLDEDGRPIAGALVRAQVMDEEVGQPVLGTDVDETGADGRFRLTIAATTYQLDAFHDRFGAARARPIVDLAPGEIRELELTMIPGCIITGRVTGDGIPPGGGGLERAASVAANAGYASAGTFGTDGRFIWSTDEETTFVLRAFPWKASPSAPRQFACRAGVRYDDVVFEIPQTEPDLAGTVVTATGAPSPYAQVDITGVSNGQAQQERTDDDGGWEARTLSPGEYHVVARVHGHGIAVARVTAPARDVALTLSGTASLAGDALGMRDGMVNLEVTCTDGTTYHDNPERFLVAVRGGTYRVDGLPACRVSMIARNGRWKTEPIEVELEPHQLATLELDLGQLATKEARGLVHDALGRPVAGAAITIPGQAGVRATTGPDGRFALRIPARGSLVIAGAGAVATREVPSDDQPTWDVDVTLGPAPGPPPSVDAPLMRR